MVTRRSNSERQQQRRRNRAAAHHRLKRTEAVRARVERRENPRENENGPKQQGD